MIIRAPEDLGAPGSWQNIFMIWKRGRGVLGIFEQMTIRPPTSIYGVLDDPFLRALRAWI